MWHDSFAAKLTSDTGKKNQKYIWIKQYIHRPRVHVQTEKIPWSRTEMGNFKCFYRFVLHNLDDAEADDTSYAVTCRDYIQLLNTYFHFLKLV